MGRVLSYESEKAVAYQRRTELEDIRIQNILEARESGANIGF